jgi:hypothetical protein
VPVSVSVSVPARARRKHEDTKTRRPKGHSIAEENAETRSRGGAEPTHPPIRCFLTQRREDAKTQRGCRRRDAAMLAVDGGIAGDLTIADRRLEAHQLRTRAFVAAALPTGRRAGGASVPPHLTPTGTIRAFLPIMK